MNKKLINSTFVITIHGVTWFHSKGPSGGYHFENSQVKQQSSGTLSETLVIAEKAIAANEFRFDSKAICFNSQRITVCDIHENQVAEGEANGEAEERHIKWRWIQSAGHPVEHQVTNVHNSLHDEFECHDTCRHGLDSNTCPAGCFED